MEKLKIANEAL